MRILIATNMFPTDARPYLGVFVKEQADSLRARGHTVDIAAHVAEDSRMAYFQGLWGLRRKLRAADYDLIHSHHTYSSVLALVARRLEGRAEDPNKIPIVETFHESEVFQRETPYHQDALRRLKYSTRLKAWALRRVDFAIPVQRDMLARVLPPADLARIPHEVIPAGIDLQRFTPGPRDEARQRLQWPLDPLTIFFPCDPAKPEKRADLARAGFDLWAANHNMQSQSRLVAAGAIPYAQMPDALRAADAILLPTDYEASPTVVKEALACERPVVSTDVGDVRERYSNLPGVHLCDWTPESIAIALAKALASPSPYGGRQRLIQQQLDLPQIAGRVERIYASILGRSGV